MRILVLGATGATGRAVVDLARARGYQVTALTRRPQSAGLPADVTVLPGDMLAPASLEPALAGQDAVVCVVGTKLSRKPTTQLSDGARHLVAAMQRIGPRRLICVTGLGAGNSRGHGSAFFNWFFLPVLLNEIYKDKTRQEQAIAASDLDWTIVRPSILTNGPARGKFRVATDLSGFHGRSIARADVAAFLLDQLTDRTFVRREPTISD